jgi:hypothetical protein
MIFPLTHAGLLGDVLYGLQYVAVAFAVLLMLVCIVLAQLWYVQAASAPTQHWLLTAVLTAG